MSKLCVSERLRIAIFEFDHFSEIGAVEDYMRAKRRIVRYLKVMGCPQWDQLTLAKHGMKSALEEIRAGRVPGCSIGPDGLARVHALELIP